MRKLIRAWLRGQLKQNGYRNINRHISSTYKDWKAGKLKLKKKRKRRKAA